VKKALIGLAVLSIACGTSEDKIAKQLYDCRSTIPSSNAQEVLGQMVNCLFIRYGWKDTAKVVIAARELKDRTAQIAPVAKLLASLTEKQARSYVDSVGKVELKEAYKESMRSSLRSLAESQEKYFADQGVSDLDYGGSGYADKWICDSHTPPHTLIFCMDSTTTLTLKVTRKGGSESRWGGWSAVMTNPKAPNVVCAFFYNTAPVPPAKEPLTPTCADADSPTFLALKAAERESSNAQAARDSAAQSRRRALAKARVDSLTSWSKCEVAHLRTNTMGDVVWENLTTDCYNLYPSNGDRIFYRYINRETFSDPAKIEYLQKQSRKIRRHQ
jgi:hypothetical protein